MKKPFFLGFYGESNTGKTTTIVKLIRNLKNRGYKIAAVKITDKKIGLDTPGKDTWRYAEAGADITVFHSDIETGFILREKKDLEDISKKIFTFGCYDLVLIEGLNDEKTPKIKFGTTKERKNTVLSYNSDFNKLFKYVLKQVSQVKNMGEIIIKVNKKEIPLGEFPSELIKNTICGMLKSLKGVNEIKEVEIKINL